MAQYQHLPIYKVTYELLQQITRFTQTLRSHGHRVRSDLTRVIV